MDEVKPAFQNRSVKATGCISTSITSNAYLPNTLHPNQDPLVNIPLVNNRKGSLLPMGPRPRAGPLQVRFSISGPGDVVARPLAESRLSRACSLPVKYRYHPSNAMLLSQSRHCTVGCPLSGMHQSVTLPVLSLHLSRLLHEGSLCWNCCCRYTCCFARIRLVLQWLILSDANICLFRAETTLTSTFIQCPALMLGRWNRN